MAHLVRSIRAGHTVHRPGRQYTKRRNRAARAHGFANYEQMAAAIRFRMELALRAGMRV